ncbi:hypothetical protein JCM9743_26760 [Natrinema sp. JCM 9743]
MPKYVNWSVMGGSTFAIGVRAETGTAVNGSTDGSRIAPYPYWFGTIGTRDIDRFGQSSAGASPGVLVPQSARPGSLYQSDT